jgi:hypothetical protein
MLSYALDVIVHFFIVYVIFQVALLMPVAVDATN